MILKEFRSISIQLNGFHSFFLSFELCLRLLRMHCSSSLNPGYAAIKNFSSEGKLIICLDGTEAYRKRDMELATRSNSALDLKVLLGWALENHALRFSFLTSRVQSRISMPMRHGLEPKNENFFFILFFFFVTLLSLENLTIINRLGFESFVKN